MSFLAFTRSSGWTDKTLNYEGHFHDLLTDIDKEVVLADIQRWIEEHIPAA